MAGERVAMVDGADSPYPYCSAGRIAVSSTADRFDPWATRGVQAGTSTNS